MMNGVRLGVFAAWGCAFVLVMGAACTPSPSHDAARKASQGVDDMGMKPYVFALLQTGDTTARPDSVLSGLFAGHMANIEGLAEEESWWWRGLSTTCRVRLDRGEGCLS